MIRGLPPDLPVVDHHAHLSPSGQGVEAARRFSRAGGTHLFLATQDYRPEAPLRLDDYAVQFETTVRLARAVREQTGVVVFSVLAPYPVDLVRQAERLGTAAAVELQKSALALASRTVRSGDAVALGEVGRCHFPVGEDLRSAVEDVFRTALDEARDVPCPVVVHSPDLDAAGYRELAEMGRAARLPAGAIVKHYARSILPVADRAGIVPSVLARRDLMSELRQQPGPWFLETDYLDDPSRPGAVLDLTTVPRRAAAWAGLGPEAVERLRIPFVDSVQQVYRLSLQVPGARA